MRDLDEFVWGIGGEPEAMRAKRLQTLTEDVRTALSGADVATSAIQPQPNGVVVNYASA